MHILARNKQFANKICKYVQVITLKIKHSIKHTLHACIFVIKICTPFKVHIIMHIMYEHNDDNTFDQVFVVYLEICSV